MTTPPLTTALTTSQAAAALGVSPRRVQAMIRAGRLKAIRFGRDWLIRPADLDAVRVRPVGRPKKILGKKEKRT